jgi:DNA polymerase-4
MSVLCRDCAHEWPDCEAAGRCPSCKSPRLIAHSELAQLAIAHIDCDAFYANVEKRDNPALRDRPVLIGGGRRGVVAAACYVSRLYGVRSAMPMFKALKVCPEAVVLRPDMAKYGRVGRQVRALMQEVTPLVEPISIDEAFLDLQGTEKLHEASPARILARLALRIEQELDLTVSIGLSYNKFLAKIASDLDKPRGYAVIGRAEARDFLADRPVGIIWGVGRALQRNLAENGITRVRDLWAFDEAALVARYGAMGRRLHRFSGGEDDRQVDPEAPTKSISAETTFEEDLADPAALVAQLWPLCETVARRLKRANLAGITVTLKLKTREFQQFTRRQRVSDPTQLAERIFETGQGLLERQADGRFFRLIGIGVSDLSDGAAADPPDLLDPDRDRRAKVEQTIDAVRAKLGPQAIGKGRSLAPSPAAERPAGGSGTTAVSSRTRAKASEPPAPRRS